MVAFLTLLISCCYCVALKNLTPDRQVSRLWLPIFQNFLFTCPWSLVLLGSDSFSPRILSWDRVWSVSSEDSTTTTHHGLLLSPASEVVYIWALLRWHRLLCSQQLPVCCRGLRSTVVFCAGSRADSVTVQGWAPRRVSWPHPAV